MKELLWVLILSAGAASGQLRSVEMSFTGIECASCVESLPARMQRMRGVESASVDAGRQILVVKLAAQNRVRLEQIRDAIEQDGTKARQATIVVKGELREEGGRWMLKLGATGPAVSQFEVSLDGAPPSAQYSLKAGFATVTGVVKQLRPASNVMLLTAQAIDPADE